MREGQRSTMVHYGMQQQQQCEQALQELKKSKSGDLELLIKLFSKYPQIKDQAQFVNRLFVKEAGQPFIFEILVTWMLNPRQLSNFQSTPQYSYYSKQIMKDNLLLYEAIYIHIINKAFTFRTFFKFLQSQMPSQQMSTALGSFVEVMVPFAQYPFQQSSQISELFSFEQNQEPCILDIITDSQFNDFCAHSHRNGIFKFLHTVLIASLESSVKNQKRVLKLFDLLMREGLRNDDSIQSVQQFFRQIWQNRQQEGCNRLNVLVQIIDQMSIVEICSKRVISSQLYSCNLSLSTSKFYAIEDEETYIESNLYILTYIAKICSHVLDKSTNDVLTLQSRTILQKVLQQNKALKCVIDKKQAQSIHFSSGQNIKPTTMIKYWYFELMYESLLASKRWDIQYPIERLEILRYIKIYLQQNRWNNILHLLLQKICKIIFGNEGKALIQATKKHPKDIDNFLEFLIQSFINNRYFTSQGNLHTLYVISMHFVNQLEHAHRLGTLINQFSYWKKFVMNDLSEYETRTYDRKIKVKEDQLQRGSEDDENQELEVDQVVSIKQIIRKIRSVDVWPTKGHKRKLHNSGIQGWGNNSKSNHYCKPTLDRNSYDIYHFSVPEKKIFHSHLGIQSIPENDIDSPQMIKNSPQTPKKQQSNHNSPENSKPNSMPLDEIQQVEEPSSKRKINQK